MSSRPPSETDGLARVLAVGLSAFVVLAPWPFGGTTRPGGTALELAALALAAAWAVRGLRRGADLPPRPLVLGMLGLLVLGAVQVLPLGSAVSAAISPASERIRAETRAPERARAAEAALLGADPESLDRPATLSVDPAATAAALRTGAAAAALLLVATTVGATGGARWVAAGLLAGAAFQGLYGLLVLVSGYDHIWHVPKTHNLDAATGTFVNKNHFACLVAMSLGCGLGAILERPRAPGPPSPRRVVRWLGPEGSRRLLLGVLLASGLAGLLASFSRAGIALGLIGLTLVALAARDGPGLRVRAVTLVVLGAAAALPLGEVGIERLIDRYRESGEELETGRAVVWEDTARMALAFPLVGSGFGTFATVYPLFRSPEVRRFYQHAHNDGLQVAAEGGVAGVVLVAVLLATLAAHLVPALAGRKGALGAGIAAGLLVFLLHALVDFNAHIPANLDVAAVLAGLLVGLPWASDR